jgi:hypothetical protein
MGRCEIRTEVSRETSIEETTGRIILKRVYKKYIRGVNWIQLAQVRVQWWALLKAVKKIRAL